MSRNQKIGVYSLKVDLLKCRINRSDVSDISSLTKLNHKKIQLKKSIRNILQNKN